MIVGLPRSATLWPRFLFPLFSPFSSYASERVQTLNVRGGFTPYKTHALIVTTPHDIPLDNEKFPQRGEIPAESNPIAVRI